MAEPATSESSPDTDRDFDPSADMMVHDFDDEHTIDEEENMSGESCGSELDDLQKESEMPLEALLAMYGYGAGGPPQDTRSSSEEEILSNQDLTLDKEEIARDLLKNSGDDEDTETSVNDLLENVQMPSQTARLLRSNSQANSDDDDESEDDVDYVPVNEDDWKKTIQVGSDYQAVVPEGRSEYGDAPAYENEDRLLWDPSKISDDKVERYLSEVQSQNFQGALGVNAIPQGAHIRDDEQALYLLLQCGHNLEEAIRRRKMQAVPPTDPMSLWSEEECRNFESGLRHYGKDFHLIQLNKVRTRSVGELVQFYYLWKKTERHDVFANKTRLEKKKYILHPGVTDYMDRFLDDVENPLPRDRSTSPSINSLIYGDPKRHHHHHHHKQSEGQHHIESPVKMSAELLTGAGTTVSVKPEPRVGLSNSTENAVHIANFTPTATALPTSVQKQEPIDDCEEPGGKRMKIGSVEKTFAVGVASPATSPEKTRKIPNHVSNVEVSFSSMNSQVHSLSSGEANGSVPGSLQSHKEQSSRTAESIAQ